MHPKKNNKSHLLSRKALIILCSVLSVILAVLIGVTAYAESRLGLINRKDPNQKDETISQSEYDANYHETESYDPDYTGEVMDSDDIIWDDDVSSLIGAGEEVVNFMLIGQDRRPGESRARSDAMILCTINTKDKTLTLSSFMRDLYVQIPGYRDNRINASYALGGMTLLDATIEKNFGVHIDGNVEVDYSGFQKAIDILGGVDIELTSAEASYLNRRGNWDYNNASAGTWSLTAGVNHLTGEQALAFSRIRSVGNGDFGRTNRQRVVLSALLDQVKDMSLKEMDALLQELLPLVTTDLSNSQIFATAFQLFPMLTDLEINTVQIPVEGEYRMTMIDGMSVLLPDLDGNREVLKEIMGE